MKYISRVREGSGAHDYYDLWVFDEFHEPDSQSSIIGATQEGRAYANTMLKILDGQECRLDLKYSRIFDEEKKMYPL